MKKNKWILWMAAPAILFACESDDNTPDVSAPVITLEELHSDDDFAAGGEIHAHGTVTDDVELAELSISIHDNFDGHSHGRVLVAAFSYAESITMSGKSFDIDHEIEIDAEATAGPYHVIFQATDAEGNATSFSDGSSLEQEIWITNDEMAHVHFQDSEGLEVEEYEAEVGVALAIYGEVEDEEGLDHVMITVGHMEEGEEHDHDHSGRTLDDEIFEMEYEVEGATSVRLEELLAGESIIVSQAEVDELEEGEHLYVIAQVQDEDGNISQFSIAVHFD